MINAARAIILIGTLTTLLGFGREAWCQSRPDLIVSSVSITADPSGLFVETVSITVINRCVRSVASPTHVLLTFKESDRRDAKTIYYVSRPTGALRGGESRSQSFGTGSLKIGIGRHLLVEVDPYKKVLETNEENNWRTLYPDAAGSPAGRVQCSAK